MSNNPFDRTIIHELEKPLADDINQLETNFDHALRFFIAALYSDPDTGTPLDGFMGTGLLVAAASPTDMSVSVTAGLGFQLQAGVENAIDSVPGLNDLEPYKPIPLLANQSFTVPSAPVAPNTRIDIIEVMADRITTDPSLRQVFDGGLGQFVPDTLNKTLAWALDGRAAQITAPSPSTAPLSYVIGQEGNPGGVPSTTPGYIKIAEIAVGSDVVAIAPVDITDLRANLNHRVSKMQWGAYNGFRPGGSVDDPFYTEGGGVADSLWIMQWGDGLEAGDILEDIVVVFEKRNAVSNSLESRVQIADVDEDAETVTVKNFGYAVIGPFTIQKLYTASHRDNNPANFPHVWKAGSTGTTLFESNGTDQDAIISTYAIVRRSIIKQDS